MPTQTVDDVINNLKYYSVRTRGWGDGTVLSHVVIKDAEYNRLKNLDGNEKNSYVAEFFVNGVSSKNEALILAVKVAKSLDDAETQRIEALNSIVI